MDYLKQADWQPRIITSTENKNLDGLESGAGLGVTLPHTENTDDAFQNGKIHPRAD